jgi:hypothetical protein
MLGYLEGSELLLESHIMVAQVRGMHQTRWITDFQGGIPFQMTNCSFCALKIEVARAWDSKYISGRSASLNRAEGSQM